MYKENLIIYVCIKISSKLILTLVQPIKFIEQIIITFFTCLLHIFRSAYDIFSISASINEYFA